MRNLDRIIPLLEKIREVWYKNPDLRFGQLIECIRGNNIDLFYLEDDKFEDKIDEFSMKNKEKNYENICII